MVAETVSAGRWKYMIVLGAFIVNFLNTGTAKSFGVLIPDLEQDLNTGVSILGLGIGMCHGVAVSLTFMSRPLLTKVTCRGLTMIGGLVASIGFCFCSISSSAVLFTFGIAVAGFGYSFMIISNVVIVKDYFVDSYSLALSVTFSGGAVGMMLIPLITEKLANIYGWRGALLLIAALNFHNVAAGALYRQFIRKTSNASSSAVHVEGHGMMGETSDSDKGLISKRKLENTENPSREGSKNQRRGECTSVNASEEDCKAKTQQRQEHEPLLKFDKTTNAKQTYAQRQSLIARESYEEITRNDQLIVTEALRTHEYDNNFERESECLLDEEQSNLATKDSGRICGVTDIFDLRLMYDFPALNLVMIAALLSGATTTGWVAFLVPNGQKKGYLMNDAVLLAIIGGLGNVIGRFGIGFTIGQRTSARVLFVVCNLVCGVTFCLNYVTSKFVGLSILSTLNGSTIGAMTVLVCLMIEEIVDDSRYASGVALTYFFLGVGEIVGGLFAGWIHDMTNTYEIPFVALGSLNFLGALLMLPTLSSCSR